MFNSRAASIIMLALTRTQARSVFKDLLGQANHFLITILVGLDGVRRGEVTLAEEFSTSWNPQSPKRSAERSRLFALDLALIRAIDSLDTYMMMSARKPCALPDAEFISRMDGTKRSVAKRLDVFDEFLPGLPTSQIVALQFAIEWRNRRVHSLSEPLLEKAKSDIVLEDRERFAGQYSGLNIEDFIRNCRGGECPTFKEAASVIRMCHEVVAHFDSKILEVMPIEQYVTDLIVHFLTADGKSLDRAAKQIWDHPKKSAKVLRLLRLVGVSEIEKPEGRQIPTDFIDELVGLKSTEVENFLACSSA